MVRGWTAIYERPLEIHVDGGPAFRNSFSEGLASMVIRVNHSSAYSQQSNSHAEKLVRNCKNILQKHQKLNQLQLDEMMLAVNSKVQSEGQCSAIINYIPNSFDNTFESREAIKRRAEVREKRVAKPQLGCKETFEIGEKVLLQDHMSKK